VYGLQEEGYDVTWATTGDEAIEAVTTASFALVLLDHMLPGKSGIEILRVIRAAGLQMPVLMLTARDSAEDRALAFAAGATAFIAKPFTFKDLTHQMQELLSSS
jgi:DNA-binding response OmpR family regulator